MATTTNDGFAPHFSILVTDNSDQKTATLQSLSKSSPSSNLATSSRSTPGASVTEEKVNNIALVSLEEAIAARDSLLEENSEESTTRYIRLIPLEKILDRRLVIGCVVGLAGCIGSFIGGAMIGSNPFERFLKALLIGIPGSIVSGGIFGVILTVNQTYEKYAKIRKEIKDLNDRRLELNVYKETSYLETAIDVYTANRNLQILNKSFTFERFMKDGKNHNKICDIVKDRNLLEQKKKDDLLNEEIKIAQNRRFATIV